MASRSAVDVQIICRRACASTIRRAQRWRPRIASQPKLLRMPLPAEQIRTPRGFAVSRNTYVSPLRSIDPLAIPPTGANPPQPSAVLFTRTSLLQQTPYRVHNSTPGKHWHARRLRRDWRQFTSAF